MARIIYPKVYYGHDLNDLTVERDLRQQIRDFTAWGFPMFALLPERLLAERKLLREQFHMEQQQKKQA